MYSPNIPNAPTVCPGHHFGIIQAGTMKMTHEDGTEITVGAGDVYECKPGHTAENIGEDEVVMIEFSQQMAVAYVNMGHVVCLEGYISF